MSETNHQPCVSLEGVTVRFGRTVAIEDISLQCMPATMTAILGPNGSGKSTLLKAILGLLEVDRGSIQLSCKAKGIGYVPQAKTLDRRFPATAMELVSTGLLSRWPFRISSDTRKKVDACLDRVGLRGYQKHLLSDLSGGELQR
ncbi:MAG: ATP-binding cassette domain-containing protein, partial [Leptospiraceae bacterium]|nr:ATP-binding cassette domain-containing protein [Leptospiraceae bacterium]